MLIPADAEEENRNIHEQLFTFMSTDVKTGKKRKRIGKIIIYI